MDNLPISLSRYSLFRAFSPHLIRIAALATTLPTARFARTVGLMASVKRRQTIETQIR